MWVVRMDRNSVVEKHYKANYKHLVNRMCSRVPDNSRHLAEEVVQDAYANALTYWDAFNPNIRPFGVWFNRILNNAANKCVQSEGGGNHLSLDDEDSDLEPFRVNDDADIPMIVVINIQKAIKKQRPEVAEVLNMFFNLGMRTREIAECTEFNHNNIRQMVRRFRIKWDDENIF